MLIWPNIIIAVNVYQGILTLTGVRHIVSYKRVTVHRKNVVVSNIQMVNDLTHTCIVWKMGFSYQFHRNITCEQQITHSSFIDILCH